MDTLQSENRNLKSIKKLPKKHNSEWLTPQKKFTKSVKDVLTKNSLLKLN
jgi:hypothetical protein